MSFQHLSCTELKNWLDQANRPVTLVDIRDPQSFVTGHIPGAILIDNSNVQKFIEESNHSDALVVCCYHGNSSQSAADFFSQNGFKECYSLDGGYEAWRQLFELQTTQ
ncbi:MAG: thiosulfate sulfurtransferase GlpE [Oleiphilaceae bacterium]|nr:thiosulfate sulfurtransferase GlpE [Oleiphilaceae bacterium]